MIQFKILSGKKAGTAWKARRFPVRIGRSPGADLVLQEEGVFEEHAVVQFAAGAGFTWQTRPEALASINGEPAREAILHNGDT
ncbi:FHA domain-containing protein, partial [Hyphobacterium sp. SN044]|uniref:FHA domain-containing protein n=1 Tax=Hyphobacterium sp. SN044 TaxID=2912575 RepID=UPI001F1FDBE3